MQTVAHPGHVDTEDSGSKHRRNFLITLTAKRYKDATSQFTAAVNHCGDLKSVNSYPLNRS
jgi:hypothetical protein